MHLKCPFICLSIYIYIYKCEQLLCLEMTDPLRTPRTRLRTKKEPKITKLTKYTHGSSNPMASFICAQTQQKERKHNEKWAPLMFLDRLVNMTPQCILPSTARQSIPPWWCTGTRSTWRRRSCRNLWFLHWDQPTFPDTLSHLWCTDGHDQQTHTAPGHPPHNYLRNIPFKFSFIFISPNHKNSHLKAICI